MMGVSHVGLVEDRFSTDATGHDNHHGYGDRSVTAALSSPPRRAGRTRWQLEEGLYLLTELLRHSRSVDGVICSQKRIGSKASSCCGSQSQGGQSEAYFQQVLAIARGQQAKS